MPEKQRPALSFLQIHCMFWLFMGCFQYIIWINYDRGPGIGDVALEYSLGGLLSFGLKVLYERVEDNSPKQQMLTSLIGALVLAVVWRVSLNTINALYITTSDEALTLGFLLHNTPANFMLLLLWSIGYWLLRYYRKFQLQQLQMQQIELEAHQAQLKMLRFQINPHFLFNVLATIDTLILRQDIQASRRVLSRISDYLRETLEGDNKETHSLRDEFRLLSLYLNIEKERFGDRLNLILPENLHCPELQVPRHFMQPLVENAIKHGIATLASGGRIKIEVEPDSNHVMISIENPISEQTVSSSGLKLGNDNVQQRLSTFYNTDASLNVQQSDETYKVIVKLPLEVSDA